MLVVDQPPTIKDIVDPRTEDRVKERWNVVKRKLKLSRNDPCWCGSGKLYKHCHRREDLEKQEESRRKARAKRRRERAIKAARR
ncbi:MAG: SEC-C domain-containing protein [Anaerolineae bacterium]